MDRLAQLRREVEREWRAALRIGRRRRSRARRAWPRWQVVVPVGLLLLVLPFVCLLRGATFLYLHTGLPTWLALSGAASLALALVTGYAAVISRALTGRARVRFVARWIAAPLVIGYCAYALLFLASVNAKTPEVQSYYHSLHPALRLAVSTFIMLDGGLVVTDIHRTPADYAAMGLPVFESSLHFRQPDGYVHAMDLRTLGRGRVRTWATGAYFRLLGFRVLRHVGTADHQHVSLPVPGR